MKRMVILLILAILFIKTLYPQTEDPILEPTMCGQCDSIFLEHPCKIEAKDAIGHDACGCPCATNEEALANASNEIRKDFTAIKNGQK